MIGVSNQLEAPYRIEPCLLDNVGMELFDLAASLSGAAGRLGNRLHPGTAASLATLVRIMNCYYSNLIEGHNTRPRDIERALEKNFDAEDSRRNLQIEARAHIRVQSRIDDWYATDNLPEPASCSFVRRLHRWFYLGAADDMLRIETGNGEFISMRPGAFRSAPGHEVSVGLHHPPSADRVSAFMEYFEQRYALKPMGPGGRIIAMAAAHHRLNYIHPFLDGNGRVSRLMSHAMGLKAGIGAHGLWSISRGLARGLESRTEYKSMMNHADMPRQGDLDGRGNLSLRALTDFTVWFLKVSLDQVTYMSDQFALDTLMERLKTYVAIKGFQPEAFTLLNQILQRGTVPRGEADAITGLKERRARSLLSALTADGILASDTPKSPVSLRFPTHAVEILFPTLYPQT